MQEQKVAKLKEAIREVREDIAKFSSDPEKNKEDLGFSYANLGLLHMQLGETAEACRLWEIAANDYIRLFCDYGAHYTRSQDLY